MEEQHMKQLQEHEHRITTLELRDAHLQNRMDANDIKLDRIETKMDARGKEHTDLLQQVVTHNQRMEESRREASQKRMSHKEKIHLKLLGWVAAVAVVGWTVIQAIVEF